MGLSFIRQTRLTILIVVLAALALRSSAALTLSLHHADEIGQYLDQAHRLVFGYGTEPWEYRAEMRSWLIPLFLSGPMALGDILAPEGSLYLNLPKLAVAFLSLPVLWAAWSFGRLLSREQAWIALWVAAIWFEFIFFAGHVLSEPLALAAILPGAALLMRGSDGRLSLIAAGFLLAVGAVLRFHYGPAIVFFVIAMCWRERRNQLPLVFGGAIVALILSALADMVMGQVPFQWMVNNAYQNLVANRADAYGTSGPLGYFAGLRDWWGLVGLGILLLLAFDGRKLHPNLAILFWTAIVNFGLHSLIGHKEYRFILLSTSIIVILAAIGSLDLAQKLAGKWPKLTYARMLPIAALLWLSASAGLAFTSPGKFRWHAYGGTMHLMAKAKNTPSICAIGLDRDYWNAGSYAVLHRPIPLYVTSTLNPGHVSAETPINGTTAYNAVIAHRTRGVTLGPAYKPIACSLHQTENGYLVRNGKREDICLFQRAGGCAGAGLERFRINEWLRDHGL